MDEKRRLKELKALGPRREPAVEIDWSRNIYHPSPLVVDPVPLTRGQAEDRLEIYIKEREERYETLSNFLEDNGLRIKSDGEYIRRINKFFAENVYCGENSFELDHEWFVFCQNMARYIGDQVIASHTTSGTHWTLEELEPEYGQTIPDFAFVVGGFKHSSETFWPHAELCEYGNNIATRRRSVTDDVFNCWIRDPFHTE